MRRLIVLLGLIGFVFLGANAQNNKEIDGLFYKGLQRFTGIHITSYSDGAVKSKIRFKNGEKHGKTYIYFNNGQVHEIRSYKNNLMHGKWTMYNKDGVKVSVARYKNGLKHGKWYIWDDTGQLLYKISYSNGIKRGVWKKSE